MIKIVGTPGKILLDLLKSVSIEPVIVDFPLGAKPEDVLILVDPAQIQWVRALQLQRKCHLVLVKDQNKINHQNFYAMISKIQQQQRNIA
jgi:hypothetical protein